MTRRLCATCDGETMPHQKARTGDYAAKHLRTHVIRPHRSHKVQAPPEGWGVIKCHWCPEPVLSHFPGTCPHWDGMPVEDRGLKLVRFRQEG